MESVNICRQQQCAWIQNQNTTKKQLKYHLKYFDMKALKQMSLENLYHQYDFSYDLEFIN